MIAYPRYVDPLAEFTRAWYAWTMFMTLGPRATKDFFVLPE